MEIILLAFCIMLSPFPFKRLRIKRKQKLMDSYEWRLDILLKFLEREVSEVRKGTNIGESAFIFSHAIDAFVPKREHRIYYLERLRIDGHIEEDDPPRITIEGLKFINNGGYTRLLNNRKLEDEKLRNDAKLSKWQAKVFWPLFIIAILGFIISIIALLK